MNDSGSNLSTQGNSNAPASLASGTMPLRQEMSRALPKMYQRVYLTVIGTLIATVAVTALILHFVILDGRRAMAYRTFVGLGFEIPPSEDCSNDELTKVIKHSIECPGGQISVGEGKLGARVQVSGTDEVAVLAESFNRAAARVEALVAAQKRLLAFASHELRSPLARIQMALSLVGTHKDEEARGEINTSIRELDKLIGEILLSSRFDSENFQAVMSRQPIDLTGLAAEEGARAGVEIQGEHLHVLGDITLLRRLIRNLIENAQRYAGGTLIMVRVERYESNKALIAVSDPGPGVPADQRELVFEPFYRIPGSSDKDGGVGLGLALVRSIASQHSGRAYYVDREGGGACFCVALPLAAAT